MIRSPYFALFAISLLACGKGDDGGGASGGVDKVEPSVAANVAAKPTSNPSAKAEAEGEIKVTIEGQEKVFSHLDAVSNYVLATNFTLVASTEAGGGEELRIMGTGLTIPAGGPFPLTITTEAPAEYMKRHKAHLAGKGPRTLQKRLNIMYTDANGVRYVSGNDAALVVSSFDDGKVVGTLSATKLTPKKGEPLTLGGGTLEVATTTPAAGRAVEKGVTGQ